MSDKTTQTALENFITNEYKNDYERFAKDVLDISRQRKCEYISVLERFALNEAFFYLDDIEYNKEITSEQKDILIQKITEPNSEIIENIQNNLNVDDFSQICHDAVKAALKQELRRMN